MTLPQAFEIAFAHHQAGRLAEAEQLYRQILAVAPQHPAALHMLGVIAHQRGRSDLAVGLLRQASALSPHDPGVHSNLGEAYRTLGQGDDAIAEFRRALQLQPHHAACHFNLGNALTEQGRLDEAIVAFQAALTLQPDYAKAHNNLGYALLEQGSIEEAIACFRRALRLQPDYADAHNNLGNALKDQGQIAASIAAYRQTLALRPDDVAAHDNLLLNLHYPAEQNAEEIFQEHCRWDSVHTRSLTDRREAHANDPSPERRLRIGYVSPDFRTHPVATFFEHLLATHDSAQVEIFCYADLLRADAVTARLKEKSANWRVITGMPDAQVAELVRQDRIDLLVDLAGHTAFNRLPVFARKPAPVQVTWLGYCDTTGMPAMDYRLTDAHADPPGSTERFHTEQLVRLPACAWCFRPPDEAPPVVAPPVARTGHVTFGSFNSRAKITTAMLTLWSRIVLAVPGAHLLLKNPSLQDRATQLQTLRLLEQAGLPAERITLLGRTPTIAEHLASYARVDLALDTFPYLGTTTTCEALWMGVPVITLAGQTHASRVGVSLLTNAGLPELIAQDADDYLRLAVQLATDPTRLADLRATLRDRMAASPLMDAPRFARNLEAAYREMWRKWCAVSSDPASLPCPR